MLTAVMASPLAAQPLSLDLPAPAEVTATQTVPMASFALPTGPWADGTLPTRAIEGPMTRTSWRLAGSRLTTLQLFAPLRSQIEAAGYRIVFQCAAKVCGGFDFRYGIDVLSEPDMHVDFGDFQFLSAERGPPAAPEAVSLLVSRSAETGFVQLISVGGAAPIAGASPPDPVRQPDLPADPGGAVGDLGATLRSAASVALDDLAFETGSAKLAGGEYASLAALAEFLRTNPDRTVTLVGHTDASGGLAGNIALSKDRANSVRQRLITEYAVPAAQVAAEGAGYLAPRATNLTEDGRAKNRRVEVMLTPTP